MPTEPELCTSFARCVYDFQTLISGLFAIVAAIGSIFGVWYAANLPIRAEKLRGEEKDERRRQYISVTLSSNFELLAARARQARGTIQVVIAADAEVTENIRRKVLLNLHPILDDWEHMSLIPRGLAMQVMRLRRRVEDHNFDMERAGGAFGADNFRQAILARIAGIENLALALSGEIRNLGH